jgi:hypothetical protein
MTDARGRFSTASSLQYVRVHITHICRDPVRRQISDSNNGTCIDENSPHSTISSATEQPTSTVPSQGTDAGQQHGNNGAILGGAVGGGIAL